MDEAGVEAVVRRVVAELPVPRYHGPWKAGKLYAAGSLCTANGNLWHCDSPTRDRPATSDAWKMCVRRRDTRDMEFDPDALASARRAADPSTTATPSTPAKKGLGMNRATMEVLAGYIDKSVELSTKKQAEAAADSLVEAIKEHVQRKVSEAEQRLAARIEALEAGSRSGASS